MGKLTISMAIFNSFFYVYHRVVLFSPHFPNKNPQLPSFLPAPPRRRLSPALSAQQLDAGEPSDGSGGTEAEGHGGEAAGGVGGMGMGVGCWENIWLI